MKKKILILPIALCSILLIPVLFSAFRHIPALISMLGSFEKFRNYILNFRNKGIFVYIFFQTIQVLIPGIPSEVVQSVGGYVFGTFWGTVFSLTGTLFGGITAFYSGRALGTRFISKIISEKNINRINQLLDIPKANTVVFLIYLTPGMPKDVLNYTAGLTSINSRQFFMLATLGRLPYTTAVVYMGTTLHQRNFTVVIVILIAIIALFTAGFLLRDKLIAYFKGHTNS